MQPQILLILTGVFFFSCGLNKDNKNFSGVQLVIEEKLKEKQEYSIFKKDFVNYIEEEYDLYNKYFHHLKTINANNLSAENKAQMDYLNIELQNAMKKIDDLKATLANPAFYDPQKRFEQILNKQLTPEKKRAEVRSFLKNIPDFYSIGKTIVATPSSNQLIEAISIQKDAYFYIKEDLPQAELKLSKNDIESALLAIKDYLAFCESKRTVEKVEVGG